LFQGDVAASQAQFRELNKHDDLALYKALSQRVHAFAASIPNPARSYLTDIHASLDGIENKLSRAMQPWDDAWKYFSKLSITDRCTRTLWRISRKPQWSLNLS
jgi:hypothetical protein